MNYNTKRIQDIISSWRTYNYKQRKDIIGIGSRRSRRSHVGHRENIRINIKLKRFYRKGRKKGKERKDEQRE